MTDKDTLKAMLARAGIEINEEDTGRDVKAGHTVFFVERGYSGFFTAFEFGPSDQLVDVSAWE